MDWRIYHSINDWAADHTGLVHADDVLMTVAVVLLVLAAVALWVVARPDGSSKWTLAAGGALMSGALAFALNQAIHAAFGIAWAVFLYDRTVGAVFLAVATFVGISRVVTGAHYPGDALAGVAVGLVAALVVVRLGRPLLLLLVRLVERLTDPLVRPLWRRAAH